VTNLNSTVLNPNYANPGDTLRYETTTENQLISRYVRGSLEADFSMAGAANSNLVQTLLLNPLEKESFSQNFNIATNLVNSQPITVTSKVNGIALRTNADALKNKYDHLISESLLYTKFDEDYGETSYINSINDQHNINCSYNSMEFCPKTGLKGQMGKAISFSCARIINSLDAYVGETSSLSLGVWLKPANKPIVTNGPSKIILYGSITSVDPLGGQATHIDFKFMALPDGKIRIASSNSNNSFVCNREHKFDEFDSNRRLVSELWNHLVFTFGENGVVPHFLQPKYRNFYTVEDDFLGSLLHN
jgi:hypothetical protein